MKKLIIANWKMNPASQKEALDLFDAVKKGVEKVAAFAKASAGRGAASEVVICPPFLYLAQLRGLTLGAQNVSLEVKGAFTSQISATQLKDLGVKYVIVGHSEPRRYLHETNEEINKKVKAVLDAGMTPVLCVGENEGEDRDEVLKKQIEIGLNEISNKNLVIAYEPVWAIGTGKNCQPEDVKVAMKIIKSLVGDIKVLYGGSVNAENAKQYLEIVDGLLIGGGVTECRRVCKNRKIC